MRTSARHVASKALAMEEIKKAIVRKYKANKQPIPPPDKLEELAQKRFIKLSVHPRE
jgi:hypothetical protein